jgi:hypothetical protein
MQAERIALGKGTHLPIPSKLSNDNVSEEGIGESLGAMSIGAAMIVKSVSVGMHS